MTSKRAVRIYPTSCTSEFCGRIECTGCANKPALDAFKAWVAQNNAKPADPIWSPNVYIAQVAA